MTSFAVAVASLSLGLAACDRVLPTAGLLCVEDRDCAGGDDGPHYCAPTEPTSICLPGVAEAPPKNRPPVVRGNVVVARVGERFIGRVDAFDLDGDALSYRLAFSDAATGIMVLLDPETDDVEPGTFRFQATASTEREIERAPFQIVVGDATDETVATIYTVVLADDANASIWTGDSDESFDVEGNWTPLGVPAVDAAVVVLAGTPRNLLASSGVQVSSTYIGADVIYDLDGATVGSSGETGHQLVSASAAGGVIRTRGAIQLAGVLPSLQVSNGAEVVGPVTIVGDLFLFAGAFENPDRLDIKLESISVEGDMTQPASAAGIVLDDDNLEDDRRPYLSVGRDLRLDSLNSNRFRQGEVFVGRSFIVRGAAFQPGPDFQVNFSASDEVGELRFDSPGLSYLSDLHVLPGARVRAATVTVRGDLDIAGIFAAGAGSVVEVEGTLRLRRTFKPASGPYGRIRASRCAISPFITVPSWITCLDLPEPDAGSPFDAGTPGPAPDAGEPEDAGAVDAGEPEDAGTEDAGEVIGEPDGGVDDAGFDGGSPLDAGDLDAGLDAGDLDAGPIGSDGGVPPVDAGTTGTVSCALPSARSPGLINGLVVAGLSYGPVTSQIEIDPRDIQDSTFTPVSGEFPGGFVTVDSEGVVVVTPALSGTFDVQLQALDSTGGVATVCLDILVVDDTLFFVLEAGEWDDDLAWRGGSQPPPNSDVFVAPTVAGSLAIASTNVRNLYVSSNAELETFVLPPEGEASLQVSGSLYSGGSISGPVRLSISGGETIAGNLGDVHCSDGLVNLGANAHVKSFSPEPNSFTCSLNVDEHRLTVDEDMDLDGELLMTAATSTLAVDGDISVSQFSMSNSDLRGRILARGGSVSLAGDGQAVGVARVTVLLDRVGAQSLDMDDIGHLVARGSGLLSITTVDVGLDFTVDRPITFAGASSTRDVVFLADYETSDLSDFSVTGECVDADFVAGGGTPPPCGILGN